MGKAVPVIEKEYTNPLTEVDRVKIRQKRSGNTILEFSVQYEALINGRWRKITRYDNSHSEPHRHVYYPSNVKYKHIMTTTDSNKAFTEAQAVIKRNFKRMRESYIIDLERKQGGKS